MSFLKTGVTGLVCTILLPSSSMGQGASPEAQARLDYLVGSWDVITEFLDADGNVTRTNRSVDVTEPFIGEKVLLTLSLDANGSVRKSLRFYDEAEQRFYQIDVGESGDVWMLSGGLEEYVMTSQSRSTRNGSIIVRFTHFNIQPNSFEAFMEVTRDGGETWRRANSNQRLERRVSPER